MAIKAIRVNVDGSFTHVEVADNISELLGDVFFQCICSASGETNFWCDEEGKLKLLPVNRVATDALYALNPAFVGHDFLVGPVLITGGSDDEGETLPIGQEALTVLGIG